MYAGSRAGKERQGMTNILLLILIVELSGIMGYLKDIAERGKDNAGKRDGN